MTIMRNVVKSIAWFLSRLIAVVCAVLFVVVTVAVVILVNAERQLLAPGIYKRALARQDLYARLPALVAETIAGGATYNPCAEDPDNEACRAEGESGPAESALTPIFTSASPDLRACLQGSLGEAAYDSLAGGRPPTAEELDRVRPCLREHGLPAEIGSAEGGAPLYFLLLGKSDWEAILGALLPPDWLQAQVERTLDQLFAYLDFKAPSGKVTISLVELRSRLTGEPGIQVVLQILRAQPACTQDQLDQLSGPEMESLPICRPSETMIADLTPKLQQILQNASADWPEEAVILPAESDGRSQEEDPRGGLLTIRTAVRFSPLLPIALLGLIALFGVRSLQGWLRWWGIPLLLAGLLAVGLAIAALPALDWAIANHIAGRIPALFTPSLQEAGFDLLREIARSFVLGLGIAAGVVAAAGLAMVTIPFLTRRTPDRAAALKAMEGTA